MQVIVDNLAVEYQDQGTGRVLLFLHGWGDSLHSFDNLSQILNKEYRVVRLDLPGFGKSEQLRQTWNLDNYVGFVNNFIKKLNLDVYVIIGHSFGGRITIKGIAEAKLKSRKIVLIGSAGIAKRKTFKNYFFMVLAKVGNVITYIPPLIFYRDGLRKKMYSMVGSDYLNAGSLKQTFLKVISEDLTECAERINIPSLLIWGENDTETPLADGERLAKLIKNSEIQIIKNSGHFVHKEKAEEVVEIIKKFL